jgi:hypothetical protein
MSSSRLLCFTRAAPESSTSARIGAAWIRNLHDRAIGGIGGGFGWTASCTLISDTSRDNLRMAVAAVTAVLLW